MVQRVTVGQIRFNVPGLAADARGVALGRQLVLRFAALDRLVAFLRLWSAEEAIDDLQPGLRIARARAVGGTREVLVILPASSTGEADAVARAARTAGGQCFTGSGRHFVQYRDGRAPLGYDAEALATGEGDLALYAMDYTVTYAFDGDVPLDRLLLRLELRRESAPEDLAAEPIYVTARRGVAPALIEHLERARRRNPTLQVSAGLCESTGGTFQQSFAFWLFRIEGLPGRLSGLLTNTPGISTFVPVSDNVAVASGYRHPVHLDACKTVFPAEELFLFSPPPEGVTVIRPFPSLAPLADLVRLRSSWSAQPDGDVEDRPAAEARPAGGVELVVPLRLEPTPALSAGVGGRAVATLIPWEQATWLRSICYALPATALRGYRLALLDRGLFLVAPSALDGLPMGRLFHALAPGVFVPVGFQLRPSVSAEHLAGRTGATGGAAVVFPAPDEAPFRIPADIFEPLEARSLSDPHLADLPVPVLRARRRPVEPVRDVEIENHPLGPLPVWNLGG